MPTTPAIGRCEVVVFAQDANTSLGLLPLDRIAMLYEALADRTARVGAEEAVKYEFTFENRGAESGLTLNHPHGQIYAYPLVPPVAARIQQLSGEHYSKHGLGVLEQHIEAERKDAVRMLYEGVHAVAFVRVCARYLYEVWVASIRPANSFTALTDAERADLARALKTVLRKYDLQLHSARKCRCSSTASAVSPSTQPSLHSGSNSR